MPAISVLKQLPQPGFSFDNYERNLTLEAKGFPVPKARKTGTTIVGIKFKDGVILGGDTRATEGSIVADKNCMKIHFIAKNMYCCGAGTAADTEMVTKMVSSQVELSRLNTGRTVHVTTAEHILKQHLFRYQGHIGAALILGGVDPTGPHLYQIHPHGSSNELPYITMGSGCLAAMSVFEQQWKPEMTEEEGKKLVRDGIAAGIFNDLGSGSNVDLCVIRMDGTVDYLRNVEECCQKGVRNIKYTYAKGTTPVLKVSEFPVEIETSIEYIIPDDGMDTSG